MTRQSSEIIVKSDGGTRCKDGYPEDHPPMHFPCMPRSQNLVLAYSQISEGSNGIDDGQEYNSENRRCLRFSGTDVGFRERRSEEAPKDSNVRDRSGHPYPQPAIYYCNLPDRLWPGALALP